MRRAINPTTKIINPDHFGVSFSAKQCANFSQSPVAVLDWLIDQGWRRFRLMSYWDQCQPEPGTFDFTELDRQVKTIAKSGGIVTLCLGARQPRWPENHWPDWAWQLPPAERNKHLSRFIGRVVRRYRSNSAVISYQLENEALLTNFGERPDTDRARLRREFKLVKQLDPHRPIIMTTSTSWGIPLRRPLPDIVGFSFYQMLYSSQKNDYTLSFHRPWLDRLRALAIRILWHRQSFIHELQCEPWGPKISGK